MLYGFNEAEESVLNSLQGFLSTLSPPEYGIEYGRITSILRQVTSVINGVS